MINTYFGTFKTFEEMKEYNKQAKIGEYVKLCRRFAENPIIELSVMMSDLSLVLVDQFGMSWDEVEALETV